MTHYREKIVVHSDFIIVVHLHIFLLFVNTRMLSLPYVMPVVWINLTYGLLNMLTIRRLAGLRYPNTCCSGHLL